MSHLWTGADWTPLLLKQTYEACEEIALGEMGLNIYRNQIEVISSEQMLDAYASIGMPIYYKHWSFGKHFSQEWDSYKKGRSGLAYELVINSNPCINYLMEDNTMTTQALVIAHAAFGHNHFFKNNYMFKTWTDADAIIDYLVFARDYVAGCEEREGAQDVEMYLDACHALMDYGVNRYKRPAKLSLAKEKARQRERAAYLETQVNELWRMIPQPEENKKDEPDDLFPAQPEENILYFLEKHAPNLKPWQRELIRIVRKVAQYFYPQGQTKLMNEGFASWTHYKIMNRLHEKGLTTDGAHIEFLKLHGNVLYQPSYKEPGYSGFNPYKLGFEMLRDIERICTDPTDEDRRYFKTIIGENPLDVIKDAVANYRDESFVRQFLSPKVVRDFRMFHVMDDKAEPFYEVRSIQNDQGFEDIRERLAQQYERDNRLPHIEVAQADIKGTRALFLEHKTIRERELHDPDEVLEHVHLLWGYPVYLHDQDDKLIAACE